MKLILKIILGDLSQNKEKIILESLSTVSLPSIKKLLQILEKMLAKNKNAPYFDNNVFKIFYEFRFI